jgi:hypothetical protein
LTPVWSEPLNGRPVVIVAIPDSCQPPTMPLGSSEGGRYHTAMR